MSAVALAATSAVKKRLAFSRSRQNPQSRARSLAPLRCGSQRVAMAADTAPKAGTKRKAGEAAAAAPNAKPFPKKIPLFERILGES